jgi:mono/diheme cytochrome c family protein
MRNSECRMQNSELRKSLRTRRTPLLHSAFCILNSAFILSLFYLTACHQKMASQPRYDPLEASDFFEDGMSARPRLIGTVARGELVTNPFLATGKIGDQAGDGFPFPVTEQVINRGQERYDIFCSECHGRVGDGLGMIPARGYRQPPSFHTEVARAWTTGHVFDVMTSGFGSMPSYRTMVPVTDRWAIIAYIRVLQLSQNATQAEVPAAQRVTLQASMVSPPAEAGATSLTATPQVAPASAGGGVN